MERERVSSGRADTAGPGAAGRGGHTGGRSRTAGVDSGIVSSRPARRRREGLAPLLARGRRRVEMRGPPYTGDPARRPSARARVALGEVDGSRVRRTGINPEMTHERGGP